MYFPINENPSFMTDYCDTELAVVAWDENQDRAKGGKYWEQRTKRTMVSHKQVIPSLPYLRHLNIDDYLFS